MANFREPIATEQEAVQYNESVASEAEEEERPQARVTQAISVNTWYD